MTQTILTAGTSIPIPFPRIERFEHLAYGLFLHWALYSQLGRGEWIQHLGKTPQDEYARLQDTFTAEDWDAPAAARLAKQAGMRYITLTTRHHDGFSLYDTRGLSTYDAPHSPAKRDLVAEFAEACRAEGIIPFFYHTTLDWRWDSAQCSEEKFAEYLDYLNASVEILCTHYGPVGFFFDGNWSRPGSDWQEERLYTMIHRLQPEAIIINNTGLEERGKSGHPEIDSVTFEQGLPTLPDRAGAPRYHGRDQVMQRGGWSSLLCQGRPAPRAQERVPAPRLGDPVRRHQHRVPSSASMACPVSSRVPSG